MKSKTPKDEKPQNNNNTSSSYPLPSEFKSLWESFLNESLINSMSDFFNYPLTLANIVQELVLAVEKLVEGWIRQKIKEISVVLGCESKEEEEQSLRSEISHVLRSKFSNLLKQLLNDKETERSIGFLLQNNMKPLSQPQSGRLEIIKMPLEELQQKLEKFHHSEELNSLIMAIIPLVLYSRLHEPKLEFQRQNEEERIVGFSKKSFDVLDGFPKEESPSVIIVSPPKRGKNLFLGLKPGVLILECAQITKEIQEITRSSLDKQKKHKTSLSFDETQQKNGENYHEKLDEREEYQSLPEVKSHNGDYLEREVFKEASIRFANQNKTEEKHIGTSESLKMTAKFPEGHFNSEKLKEQAKEIASETFKGALDKKYQKTENFSIKNEEETKPLNALRCRTESSTFKIDLSSMGSPIQYQRNSMDYQEKPTFDSGITQFYASGKNNDYKKTEKIEKQRAFSLNGQSSFQGLAATSKSNQNNNSNNKGSFVALEDQAGWFCKVKNGQKTIRKVQAKEKHPETNSHLRFEKTKTQNESYLPNISTFLNLLRSSLEINREYKKLVARVHNKALEQQSDKSQKSFGCLLSNFEEIRKRTPDGSSSKGYLFGAQSIGTNSKGNQFFSRAGSIQGGKSYVIQPQDLKKHFLKVMKDSEAKAKGMLQKKALLYRKESKGTNAGKNPGVSGANETNRLLLKPGGLLSMIGVEMKKLSHSAEKRKGKNSKNTGGSNNDSANGSVQANGFQKLQRDRDFSKNPIKSQFRGQASSLRSKGNPLEISTTTSHKQMEISREEISKSRGIAQEVKVNTCQSFMNSENPQKQNISFECLTATPQAYKYLIYGKPEPMSAKNGALKDREHQREIEVATIQNAVAHLKTLIAEAQGASGSSKGKRTLKDSHEVMTSLG